MLQQVLYSISQELPNVGQVPKTKQSVERMIKMQFLSFSNRICSSQKLLLTELIS